MSGAGLDGGSGVAKRSRRSREQGVRFQLESSNAQVELFLGGLREALRAQRYREHLHVVRPGAPEVREYTKGDQIISLAVEYGGPEGRSLILESEEASEEFDTVVADAVRRTIQRARKELVKGARRRKLREKVLEALEEIE
jgi:hypothetical protein